jgi:hypothetical protein
VFIAVYKNRFTGLLLGQINPIHIITPHFYKTNFNIIFPSIPRFPKYSLTFRFSTKRADALRPFVVLVPFILNIKKEDKIYISSLIVCLMYSETSFTASFWVLSVKLFPAVGQQDLIGEI